MLYNFKLSQFKKSILIHNILRMKNGYFLRENRYLLLCFRIVLQNKSIFLSIFGVKYVLQVV